VKGDFPLYKLMVRSKVKAAHVTEVEAAVKRVFAALQNEPTLADVSSDQKNKALQFNLTIDRDTASRLGLKVS